VSGTAIQIQRRADGVFVDATLIDGVVPTDLLVVEAEWVSERSLVLQELLGAGVPRPKWPQSLGWDWRRKAPQLKLLESAGFGVVCEQQWQGVMLTKSASHVSYLSADKGKPLIYIDFLEIAPWNWPIPELSRNGKFRGIGSTLFWKAVAQSEQEGFHGRVGLHALPQAEQFYEKGCGMTPLNRDAAKQNLLYMELSRQQAEKILRKGEAS
jgi:hypothetical protein